MPKIVDKAEMRAKILEAGMDTFIKYGFNNSSMAKIAKEAGMAKGTVYLYYDSKESLSLCILNEHFERMGRQLLQEAELDSLDDFKQHLLKFLTSLTSVAISCRYCFKHLDLIYRRNPMPLVWRKCLIN